MNSHRTLRRHAARVIFNHALAGPQYQLHLEAPELAPVIQPGQFVHIVCDEALTLPRPFSVWFTDPEAGTVDILYKVVGAGTRALVHQGPGRVLPVLGPIGTPFTPPPPGSLAVLIGGGVGLPPVEFQARLLDAQGWHTLLFVGLEGEVPFPVKRSRWKLPIDDLAQAALAYLEERSIPNRLASLTPRKGFYHGYVTDLAEAFLTRLPEAERCKVYLYACGPFLMMREVARLAERFQLSGQVSLEEHMACAFGGCAGCVAPIRMAEPDVSGPAASYSYRRVCVDGPVFSLDQVVWDRA
jgi:dihydroorotate dehydrogenase electron transfer subunit